MKNNTTTQHFRLPFLFPLRSCASLSFFSFLDCGREAREDRELALQAKGRASKRVDPSERGEEEEAQVGRRSFGRQKRRAIWEQAGQGAARGYQDVLLRLLEREARRRGGGLLACGGLVASNSSSSSSSFFTSNQNRSATVAPPLYWPIPHPTLPFLQNARLFIHSFIFFVKG